MPDPEYDPEYRNIERDMHFVPKQPLSAYANDAHQAGRIIT